MNTSIHYLYRDADNYKVHNQEIISGSITKEQINEIISCLYESEYFIPSMVGLSEMRFSSYDPEVDHPFFELSAYSFESTSLPPSVDMDCCQLVQNFKAQKNNWEKYEIQEETF